MKPATIPPTEIVNGPTEIAVLAAVREALKHQVNYALSALIAGQLLREFRDALSRTSHCGKSSIHGRNQHSPDDGFLTWLAAKEIPKTTAYRWMEAAERVVRLQLGLLTAEILPSTIEVEGTVIPISAALTLPESELPAKALKLRQGVFDFMADHTLTEAIGAAVDGESPAHRITRAGAGKLDGGSGGDRKAFDQFAKTKLKHLTTFLNQRLPSGQKGEIVTAFNRAIESWPRWILEALADKCRNELRLSEEERDQRKDF